MRLTIQVDNTYSDGHHSRQVHQVTSTAELTSKRRDIARILTILNGRKSGIEKQAQKQADDTKAAPSLIDPAPAGEKTSKKTKKAK